jgi:enoyl-CoA hydratase
MRYPNLDYVVDGPIAVVAVNRPRTLNAIIESTLHELMSVVDEVAADASAKVMILTGAGDRSFMAGADVREMVSYNYLNALRFARLGQRLCAAIEEMEKPAIAAINGYALGAGCELAMACDFAYAAEDATIGMPEVNMGIIPGFGGIQRLLRRVPIGMARELILTGRPVEAAEALRLGLVNGIFAQDELMQRVRQIALNIAEKGPLAIARAKRLMASGLDLALAAANAIEGESFAGLFATRDQEEGMTAFLEKRAPQFSGS